MLRVRRLRLLLHPDPVHRDVKVGVAETPLDAGARGFGGGITVYFETRSRVTAICGAV